MIFRNDMQTQSNKKGIKFNPAIITVPRDQIACNNFVVYKQRRNGTYYTRISNSDLSKIELLDCKIALAQLTNYQSHSCQCCVHLMLSACRIPP